MQAFSAVLAVWNLEDFAGRLAEPRESHRHDMVACIEDTGLDK